MIGEREAVRDAPRLLPHVPGHSRCPPRRLPPRFIIMWLPAHQSGLPGTPTARPRCGNRPSTLALASNSKGSRGGGQAARRSRRTDDPPGSPVQARGPPRLASGPPRRGPISPAPLSSPHGRPQCDLTIGPAAAARSAPVHPPPASAPSASPVTQRPPGGTPKPLTPAGDPATGTSE